MKLNVLALAVTASFILTASSAFACDEMGGERHEAKGEKHHEISLIPQAHAAETPDGSKTASFKVDKMMCSSCYNKVSGALKAVPGVKDVKIDSKKNQVTVAYLPEKTNTDAMFKAVSAVGFEAKTN